MLSHASVFTARACFEHSILLKVTLLGSVRGEQTPDTAPSRKVSHDSTSLRETVRATRGSATGFLIATTYIYAIGAGITAAAGTRLALQSILVKWFKLFSFQLQSLYSALLFLVTTSLSWDWVICAPAAFLGCGSRFSGSLSGIEP